MKRKRPFVPPTAKRITSSNYSEIGQQSDDHLEDIEYQQINGQEEWEKLRKWAATCTILGGAYAAGIYASLLRINNVDRPIYEGQDYARYFFLQRLTTMKDGDCRDLLRMGKNAFRRLVELIRQTGLVRDTSYSTIEEKLAVFLSIVGHNERYRKVRFNFWQSSETVNRYFHQILEAIVSLYDRFIRQPDGLECPPKIKNDRKFWPYFKDCIGALDGTHVHVKVSSGVAQRYRGRKNYPTQNVLAACSFDLMFTYVLPGWEGTASDSRILNNALSREMDRLVVPEEKYYLVDAGYQLKVGFLAPYRSTRYHLKEYGGNQPENHKELFNLRHAKLRNAIERTFGILKKRFPILASGSGSYFPVETSSSVVLACCVLHNYLMGVDPDESLVEQVDREISSRISQRIHSSSLVEECRE